MALAAAYTAILIGACMSVPRDASVGEKSRSAGYQAGDAAAGAIRRTVNSEVDEPLSTQSSCGDIGYLAFGKWGRVAVDTVAYLNLLGSATLYLILSGLNLVYLLGSIPNFNNAASPWSLLPLDNWQGILIVACVLWFHVFLKTLHEVGILSFFNIGVVVFLAVTVVVEIFINPRPEPCVLLERARGSDTGDVSF